MANDIDVLSLDEAMEAISMTGSGSNHEDRLGRWITGVSMALDKWSGDVVIRTRTEDIDASSGGLPLEGWPIASITSVTEYVSGTGTLLTAEAINTDGGYRLKDGLLYRRSGWIDTYWSGQARVVYTSGRFEDTASVDADYKLAAEMALQRLWSQYAPGWARGGDAFAAEGAGFSYFRVIDPVATELGLERRPPAVA